MSDEIELVSCPRPEREDWNADVAAGLGDHGDRFLRREFVECDACRAKSGAPVLCCGCLANRTTVGALERDVRDLRSALAEALDMLDAIPEWVESRSGVQAYEAKPESYTKRSAELRAKHLGSEK